MARQGPKWARPRRQAHLVNLFLRSGGFCVFGEWPCSCPEAHHYDPFAEAVIADWKADDRAEKSAEWRRLEREMHGLSERGPIRGRFSSVGRDIFFGQQPEYYFDGLGVSGLTFRPFAKVRLASSYVNLFVDIGDALRGLSKAKRRKAIRYGKLPKAVAETVDEACNRAVRHYLAH